MGIIKNYHDKKWTLQYNIDKVRIILIFRNLGLNNWLNKYATRLIFLGLMGPVYYDFDALLP
jgi:hypothetical protein